ncbi:MAG: TssQ family T6SS-associated lipoprotein [Rhodocyclaceae bacterium]|nr:TssQ family T6SS-associated lipoprotein [Rhodocyclaceae bacterium]
MNAIAPSAQRPGRTMLLVMLLTAFLGGCMTAPVQDPASPASIAPGEAEEHLAQGIRSYEEGRYEAATGRLHAALALGLQRPADTIRAHKHLAFIHCSTGANEPCAAAFRAILTLDPEFELNKAEAGHPMWGPVFLAVRKERTR